MKICYIHRVAVQPCNPCHRCCNKSKHKKKDVKPRTHSLFSRFLHRLKLLCSFEILVRLVFLQITILVKAKLLPILVYKKDIIIVLSPPVEKGDVQKKGAPIRDSRKTIHFALVYFTNIIFLVMLNSGDSSV